MVHKKLFLYLLVGLFVVPFCVGCRFQKDVSQKEEPVKVVQEVKKQIIKPQEVKKRYDLYSSTAYDLPLFSIVEISKLSTNVKKVVDKLLEDSQGFYLLRKNGDKVLIILQNPIRNENIFSRHDLQFVEIDLNGKVIYHNAGYQGSDGETVNIVMQKEDNWNFDETTEPQRPLKHIAYNEKGKIKFTEYWNYDEKEPIKYQMKDAQKKVISILKESQENDSNFRKEHVFYDNDGKTKMSLTVNYDGANLSRMTFYNAHDSIDSVSIISEYENGLKTKESVYNEAYELINVVVSEYIDGERKCIKVYDNDAKLVYEISS